MQYYYHVGLYAEIDEIRALAEKEDYEQSLQKIVELPEDKSELYYFGQVWRVFIYISMGNISEADQVRNDVFVPIDLDTEKKSSLTLRIAIIAVNMRVFAQMGNIEDVGTLLNFGKALINEEFINRILNFTEDHQEEINTHHDLIIWIIRFNWYSALYYSGMGDRKRAIELFKKNLRLANLIEDKFGIIVNLVNIGFNYMGSGKLELSLKYTLESLEIHKQFENNKMTIIIYSNLAYIYQKRGELDLALKYALEGYEIAKNSNDQDLQFASSEGLGHVYYQMENYELAIKYFEKSLKSPGLSPDPNETMTYLVIIYLELKDQEKVSYYFNKIEQNKNEYGLKGTDQLYRLVKALILKQKKRTLSRAKAHELFTEIIDEGSFPGSFDTSIIAIKSLIELLLDELIIYQEEEILIETQDLIYNLRKYVQENYLYPDLINALILQSRLSLVQGDISSAYKTLDQADLIAEEKNLDRCMNIVKREKELQNKEMDRWKVLSEKSSSFRERLEMANLREYIIKMKGVQHSLDS